MTATPDLESADSELPASDEHRYFRAIEAVFVELRGAPLLLSPSDWRVAKGWYRQQIPLDLVVRTLDEMFAKRRERGAAGTVSSLRYCAKAVEAAWSQAREVGAAASTRRADEGLELAPRLLALATALPADLPDRELWAEAIRSLDAAGGSEIVEAGLEGLDQRLVSTLLVDLEPAIREALDGEVEAALRRLGDRLAGDERERARERLLRERLRRRLGLPVLSLFAPEAVA